MSCAGTYNGYTYDVENRITVTPGSSPGGTMHYSYGPGNKRVWRGNGGSTDEVTFYAPNGQKLGTYALVGQLGAELSPAKLHSGNTEQYNGLLESKSGY